MMSGVGSLFKSFKGSISRAGKALKGLHWIRWLKGVGNKRGLAMHGAKLFSILAVIFVVGLGIGLGAGILVYSNDDHAPPIKSVEIESSVDDDKDYDKYEEYVLPVRVSKSERALKDLAYQEELPIEIVDFVDTSRLQELTSASTTDVEQEIITQIEGEPIAVNPEPIELAMIPTKPVDLALPKTVPLWQQRAVLVDVPAGRPMIAIVIDDVGINQAHSKAAIALSGPLTLSFMPYGYNLQDLIAQARRNGHEVMLHLPMEPLNPSINPGPNALLTSLDPTELLARIEWGLSQFGDYVGVNNHMGSRFTAWESGMRLVMGELKKRDLLFMDSVTSRDTVGFKIAQDMDVPYAVRDVFLDHTIDEENITKQLELVEKIALKKGYAIAIGHPHDATVGVLTKWLPDAQARGFVLVPISEIVKRSLDRNIAVAG